MKINMDKKYRTRDGKEVRILCTDRYNIRTDAPTVIALINIPVNGVNRELMMSYMENGRQLNEYETPFDLVEVSPYEGFNIDDKVLVKNNNEDKWRKQYFAGVSKNGRPMTFPGGRTSWSDNSMWPLIDWDSCIKYAEESTQPTATRVKLGDEA